MSHKHSIQCFALPHRRSFTSTHLEQLKNRRCSLCSDAPQVKPVTSEVSGNQSASCYQPQCPRHQHTPRRPMRPKGDTADGIPHHHHHNNNHHQYHTNRHCKKIVLVKNSNPSIQKTVMLCCKPLDSFGLFMDDASELMQFPIRKLYTLDGQKVDGVQSLLHGPEVLVCVGREPIHPLLLDRFQKNSQDKLPKLILKSQSGICNEDQGYKKNVRSGLKSKKSPAPGPFPKARENILDDDIEKRVLVNKDGSLSMEMKVRFRLLNDKTLHCSTEIKKSSCTFNVSYLGQDNVHYPQSGHGESCSEAESLSASEADDNYITELYQKHLEEPHCQHCCMHCQEYDIWKNAALSEQETLRHTESASSSAPSYKIKCKQESVDSVHTMSCEEYTEQVLEKAACIQQSVEEGDNTVQYCTISRCCSRSEVCSVSTKAQKAGYIYEKYIKNESTHTFTEQDKRPVPYENIKQGQMSIQSTQASIEDERPLSVESNSSDILASLKEDEDNEETDLSPSDSKTSQRNTEDDEHPGNAALSPHSFTHHNPSESPTQSLSPRTSSKTSSCSVKSKTSRKVVVTEKQVNVDQAKNSTPSSTPEGCQHEESANVAVERSMSEEKLEAIHQSEDVFDENGVLDTESDTRGTAEAVDTVETIEKERSSAMSTPPNPHADLQHMQNNPIVGYASEEDNIEAMSHFRSADSDTAECLDEKNKTEEPADVTHEERVVNAMSPKSTVSARSSQSRKKSKLQNGERTQSEISVHSNASTTSKQSTASELLANGTEDQIEHVMPRALSKVSGSSQISDPETSELRDMEMQIENRSPSIMSGNSETVSNPVKEQSSESLASALSTKTNISKTSKISEGTPVDMDNRLLSERVQSAMSAKSAVSVTSSILDISPHNSDVEEEVIQGRAPSANSNNSNTSSRSNTPKISTVAPKEADDVEGQSLKRPSSVRSSKSAASVTSTKSRKDDNTSENAEEEAKQTARSQSERVPSAMSAKSVVSVTSILDTSPQTNDVEEEVIQGCAPSANSNNSNTSSRSNTPKISTVAPKEADDIEGQRLKRPTSVRSSKSAASVTSTKSRKDDNTCENAEEEAKQTTRRSQSAMSSKSAVSVTSSILDISPRTSDVEEEVIQGRAPSANSNNSNTSSRSNTPKISTVAPKEADDVDGQSLKRPASVRSSKSAASVTSTKSRKDDKTCENAEEEAKQTARKSQSERVPSAMSAKSAVSVTSSILDTSPQTNDVEEEVIQGRAPSANSNNSNTSSRSNTPKISTVAPKEADDVEGQRLKRPASVRSSKSAASVTSTKSRKDDNTCENAEEEAKQTARRSQSAFSVRSQRSRNSKVCEDPRQDPADEGNRERAPSTTSCKSVLSDRPNLEPDGVHNTGSAEDLLKEPESVYEDDRATSTMSSLSNKSIALTQERASTSMSSISNVSRGSKNSVMDQCKDEGEEKQERTSILASPYSTVSAGSKRSENQGMERSRSATSGKSKTSKSSKQNTDLFCLKEPNNVKEGELVERAPSAISSKSNTSKGSDTRSSRAMEKIHHRTISPKCSSSSVKSEEPEDITTEEKAPSDISTKSSASFRSVKSNISALAGAQAGIASLKERSDSVLSDLKISVSEISNNTETEERASSALNKNLYTSSVHSNGRVSTPASASVSIGIVEEYDVHNDVEDNSQQSSSQLHSKTIENKNQRCMQTPDANDRPNSSLTARTIASDKSKKSERTHRKSRQPITDNDVATITATKKSSKHSSSHSNKSAHSSKTPDRNSALVTDRPKSNMSDKLEENAKATCSSVRGRSKSNLSSDVEEISSQHSDDVPIISVSTDKALLRQNSNEPMISPGVSKSSSSNKNAKKLKTTDLNVCSRICNGSLVASECSGNLDDSKREKNSICTHSSSSTVAQKTENNPSELVPSILPSSSPTEVVNEWLKKIPLDTALCDVEDEFHQEEEPLKTSGKVTQYERWNGSADEGGSDQAVLRPQNGQLGDEEMENNESKEHTVVETIQSCTFPDVPADVQLMKILLTPKLDRCNSLPEVSPVHGRKLSTSARGFLDSLVNLQLLDLEPNDINGKAEKYTDLMNMLQSLWLCDPSDRVTIRQKSTFTYQCSNAEECNIKSSSGLNINSSSQDSGKSSGPQTNTHAEGTEILTKIQTEKSFKGLERKSDSATPDIASRVWWTPENEAEENMPDSNILSDGTIRNDYSPRDLPDTASISNKSSVNGSDANQEGADHEENVRSESPSSEQMIQLTESLSPDSDPVWVLNLLNKIEKRFMTHYVTAVDEVKVRWNLNDNAQLDAMIDELRDEVHKRIQASVNNELRKIQGHAKRPRPPKESMSRESSTQRHRRLKVNLNQSTGPAAKTDEDGNTAILMSDQQNDEYCPCDTCIKKKASSRPVLAMEVSNSAPTMTGDTSNDKGFGKDDSLAVVGSKPEGVRMGTSSSSLEEDASDTQADTFEQLKNDQPMKEFNKMDLEKESCIAGGELVELRNGTDIVEMADADSTAEEENAQCEPADLGPEAKITEDEEEVCNELPEGEGSVESIDGNIETSGDETEDETVKDKILDKTDSMGERASDDNDTAEGEISESEPEGGGEIPEDENEKREDVTTEILETEEPKTESEDEKEVQPKSDEDETAEEERSESTDHEERDANESAEEDVALKEISKESCEDDLFDEEKINETTEDGYITQHESAERANPMDDKSAKEGETDSDELDAEGKTTKAETASDEGLDDNEAAECREKFYDDTSDRTEVIKVKTTEDGETTGVNVADVGEAGEAKATEDGDDESTEDAETSKVQIDEDSSDDETEEYGETPKAKIEDGEKSEDRIANDEEADDALMGKAETEEDRDTDDEISEIEETPCNETVGSGIATKDKTTADEETHDDDDEYDDDDDDDASEDGEASGDGKAADQRANDASAEDTEMDPSQSEEDGETTDKEVENRKGPNDHTAEDGKEEGKEKHPESDMEEVDETTDAETAEDGEQEDDGRADGWIGDDEVTEDEATTGSENEENKERAEVKTGQDGEPIESGTTEDGDKADE